MLDVVNLWFDYFRLLDLHGVLNAMLSSGIGLFIVIPIAGSICALIYRVVRR